MKKIQLLSVVFSLVMFTGITAGTAVAYAESDDDAHDFDDRLEQFCEMTDVEKKQLFEDHPRLAQFEERLASYCELDEVERDNLIDEFIAEHFPNYEERDDWDIDDMLDKYCEMSGEDKAAFLEKYPMVSDHQEKMDEYCSLNESGREAYVEEHKDEMDREHDYKKHDYSMRDTLDKYCEMTDEQKADFDEKHKAEDHQDKVEEYCSLDESGRDAFIEEHKDEMDRKHDYKKHDYDMREKMDEFCEMSGEDNEAHLKEYQKSEEHLAEMKEYCSLDDVGKDAFIAEHKDSMKDKMSDHRDCADCPMSDHKNTMTDKMSGHEDLMRSDHKSHKILRASTLTDEQKDDIKGLHSELRDFKHSLRDQSVSDSEKQEIRDQFMEKAREFSMTWLSPRHQVAAGIDAQMVECREGLTLVMKSSNTSPLCVKETTAEKLIERGIAVSAI